MHKPAEKAHLSGHSYGFVHHGKLFSTLINHVLNMWLTIASENRAEIKHAQTSFVETSYLQRKLSQLGMPFFSPLEDGGVLWLAERPN